MLNYKGNPTKNKATCELPKKLNNKLLYKNHEIRIPFCFLSSERSCAHINRFKPPVVVNITDRAKAVLLSSPLLCVCLSCILSSGCMRDAVCAVVYV